MAEAILDTTFFIDLRRGGHAGAAALWERIKVGYLSAAYSPITVYELWVGSRFDRSEELSFEGVFSLLEEAPLTASAARAAGLWLRAQNAAEVLVRDALIAASAAERGEEVYTNNTRDFALFPIEVHPY